MTNTSLVCFSILPAYLLKHLRMCVCVCVCVQFCSYPLSASQRYIQCERDLAVLGVGGARGHWREERPGLQRGVQEVPEGPEPLHALRRQRGHRPSQARAEAEESGGEEPAGPHALQLRGAGCQRGLREEPHLAQLLHRQHHHQPSRLVEDASMTAYVSTNQVNLSGGSDQ